MRPDFVIIGAQKSATSFLHGALRAHPDVFMPRNEVVYFEDPAYGVRTPAHLEWPFEQAGSKRCLGMKRAHLLGRPECPERIRRHLPTVRLIAVLRDPVERAISAYYWYMMLGMAPLKEINAGLRQLLNQGVPKHYPRAREILEFGLYHDHLERFLRHFDRDQMLILLHEEVDRNPVEQLQQVCRFIDIDVEEIPATLGVIRPKRSIYSPTRVRIRRAATNLMMRFGETDEFVFRSPRIATQLFHTVVRALDRALLAHALPNEKPLLESDIDRQLRSYYSSDFQKLRHLLDKDLNHWSIARVER